MNAADLRESLDAAYRERSNRLADVAETARRVLRHTTDSLPHRVTLARQLAAVDNIEAAVAHLSEQLHMADVAERVEDNRAIAREAVEKYRDVEGVAV